MKHLSRCSIASATVILLALLAIWYFLISDRLQNLPTTISTAPPIQEHTSLPHVSPKPKEDPKIIGSGRMAEISRRIWTTSEVQELLRNRPNSAQLYSAAYLMTGDVTLLREGLEAFPDSPALNLSLGACELGASPSERLAALTELARLEPNNTLAETVSASILIRQGRGEEAIQKLIASFRKNEWSTHVTEMASGMKELGLASNMSANDANYLGLYGISLGTNAIAPKLLEIKRFLEKSGQRMDPDLLASLGASVAIHAKNNAIATPTDTLFASGLEDASLTLVPPESEYGQTGITVAERRKQIEQQRKEILLVMEKTKAFLAADPLTEQMFIEKTLSLGDKVAQAWLQERMSAQN